MPAVTAPSSFENTWKEKNFSAFSSSAVSPAAVVPVSVVPVSVVFVSVVFVSVMVRGPSDGVDELGRALLEVRHHCLDLVGPTDQ